MWLRLIEILLSAGSYLYSAWQRVRQKQVIEAEIKIEQEKIDDKAIQSANTVRTDDNLSDDLLLSPAERKRILSNISTDILKRQSPSGDDPQIGGNTD